MKFEVGSSQSFRGFTGSSERDCHLSYLAFRGYYTRKVSPVNFLLNNVQKNRESVDYRIL